jgi:RNA polymerase sigma factor for flagellar operon FliA
LVQGNERLSFEDAVSEGCVALVQAARAYRPERGVSFASFASFRIRGAILDALRKSEPHSRQVRSRLRRYDEAWSELTAELGREPRRAEVAARLGMSRSGSGALIGSPAIRTLCLEEVGRAVERKAGVAEPAEDVAIGQIQARLIRRMVASLPPRERELVVRRYFQGDTMVSISRDLGVSVPRACEMHRRALDRLRKVAEEERAVDAA